ncbi:hypothetical protein FA09DRAFT_145285 [Tilletiopsis washingtonensis]|uniref:Uncharacterized protein n=1 Tax=Tilletiopsis washingtonensis TaxID=58919 RepID=A0A316Z4Y2_9BASI|nr:hypothetical protein FA09DRAFT_145285 [Tilletiopsis washingtonensis]PWN95265.1 hypothetical protein FA09DRAFT_145285 [Tilletiopsis washingtonensis]
MRDASSRVSPVPQWRVLRHTQPRTMLAAICLVRAGALTRCESSAHQQGLFSEGSCWRRSLAHLCCGAMLAPAHLCAPISHIRLTLGHQGASSRISDPGHRSPGKEERRSALPLVEG